MKAVSLVLLLLLVCALSACATLQYYSQSISGHMEIMRLQQPIDELIKSDSVDEALKARLVEISSMRRFASDELALPDNDSYTYYADIQRPFVVWNVFAAPEFSLELKQWCFPVVGCLSYRGFFSRQDARAFADQLRLQGYDTYTGGVRAYSTLGWFSDPVLNTFLDYEKPRLAGLVFHELAHQQLYVKGDTTFNESFASAVEFEGARRWLEQHGSSDDLRKYQAAEQRRDAILRLVSAAREQLAVIYGSEQPEAIRQATKLRIQNKLKSDYQQLKQTWGPGAQTYDAWFAGELNNAQLAAMATYRDYVPLFQQLLLRAGNDFQQFYSLAGTIAKAPASERQEQLMIMSGMLVETKPE